MPEEGKMVTSNIQLQTALYNLCVSSMKLKQSRKDTLCYSKSIDVHFRPNKPILWIFFVCVYNNTTESWNMSTTTVTWKIMLSASCNSNSILRWLKIFTLLYWMDWCILQLVQPYATPPYPDARNWSTVSHKVNQKFIIWYGYCLPRPC